MLEELRKKDEEKVLEAIFNLKYLKKGATSPFHISMLYGNLKMKKRRVEELLVKLRDKKLCEYTSLDSNVDITRKGVEYLTLKGRRAFLYHGFYFLNFSFCVSFFLLSLGDPARERVQDKIEKMVESLSDDDKKTAGWSVNGARLWTFHNVVPLLFSLYHGSELLLKAYLWGGEDEIEHHDIKGLFQLFREKFPQRRDIIDFCSLLAEEKKIPELMKIFLDENKTAVKNMHAHLRYPVTKKGERVDHAVFEKLFLEDNLKDKDKQELLGFFQELSGKYFSMQKLVTDDISNLSDSIKKLEQVG